MKKQSGFNPLTPPKAKATGRKKKGPGRTAQSGFNPVSPPPKRGPGAAAGLNPLPVGHPHHHHGGVSQTVGHGPVHAPKPKRPKRKKPVRKLSPGWDVACCSAQAVGTLLGWGHDDVLALYWRTADDPDAGASIEDTLAAVRVQRRSLAAAAAALECTTALYPWACNAVPGLILGVTLPEPHALAVKPDGTWWSWGEPFDPAAWPDLVIDEAWAVTW